MRKIITIIGIILILVGVVVMAEGKRTLTFEGVNGTMIYAGNKTMGMLSKEGEAVQPKLTIDMPSKDTLFRFEKEGYETAEWFLDYKKIPSKGNGTIPVIPIEKTKAEQVSIPEPAPEILATQAPPPKGHKPQKQRITELENTSAEQKSKIKWLEEKIKVRLEWIKGKLGDVI